MYVTFAVWDGEEDVWDCYFVGSRVCLALVRCDSVLVGGARVLVTVSSRARTIIPSLVVLPASTGC